MKFIKSHYYCNEAGELVISQKLFRPAHITTHKYRKYFKENIEDCNYELVPVLCRDSRLYKLYAFIQQMDDRFSECMCDFIMCRMMADSTVDAKNSLRDFLATYEITESDYSWETGYKRWQRSRQYKLVKRYKHEHKQVA